MARKGTDFQTLRSEGGLLPADLLRRVIDPKEKLAGTQPQDYGLPPGDRLNEAITQSWSRLLRHWAEFRTAAAKLPPGEPGTGFTNEKWSLPLLRELGFGMLPTTAGPELGGRLYAINRFFGPVPIHLVGCGVSLDRRAAGVRGAASVNPHGLVQEFLNRSPGHLWAIVSNGLTLRVLRDNQALSRQSYLEFDIEAMLTGEVYSDFVLLWLMAHASRLAPRQDGRPETCWLEEWTKLAEEQGTRALGDLRIGVQDALQILGEGFTSHPRNTALRDGLRAGSIELNDFHGQLLRVVYRLIFLFVAEDRTLDGASVLHPPLPTASVAEGGLQYQTPAPDLAQVAEPRAVYTPGSSGAGVQARARYAAHYSTARLREQASRIKGSRHGDMWRQFQTIAGALSGDAAHETTREALALPALGSFLWDPASTADLNGAELSNFVFLDSVRHLAFTRAGKSPRPVDYRNLGAEELGGVYEGLLALTPQISADGARFTFAELAGNERKTSGSYYTPDSLVQCLLDSALDPVVDEAIRGKTGAEAEAAILSLKVCDPAVGSGHFLVGAAHRLARHLARVRALAQGESEPSPVLYQHAMRDVIGRCLYGVDINPMAAELCRVSLWLEALEPGRPLSFLDHHIRVGNSLLGATPELIASGIPDAAFTPAEGDDRRACAVLKKLNKLERAGLGPLFAQEDAEVQARLQRNAAALEEMPDQRPEDIRAKELVFRRHEQTDVYQGKKRLADAWCAAFVIRKVFLEPGRESSANGITQRFLNDLAAGSALPAHLAEAVDRLARKSQFFHWHLAFPEVFSRGGFDCLLGNPPWVRQELLGTIKTLLAVWPSYSGTADLSVFFVSLCLYIARLRGRVALLTPNKWLQASYGEQLRLEILAKARVSLLVDFGHSRTLFPGVDTFPIAVVLQRGESPSDGVPFVRAHDVDRSAASLQTLIACSAIMIPRSNLAADGWRLDDERVSSLVARLRATGRPLAEVVEGRIYRGVLTGLNAAFVISAEVRSQLIAESPETVNIIKPWLTGADVKRWHTEWSGEYLIFTQHGIDIERYPSAQRHLTEFRPQLTPRDASDSAGLGRKPGRYAWFEIQDNVAFHPHLDRPKIVVPCIAYYCEFALDMEGLWPNNKVIFIASADPCLVAVLNSRINWWLMSRLMVKMKDDALSVDVHVLAQLPIPEVSPSARAEIQRLVMTLYDLTTSAPASPSILEIERRLDALVEEAFNLTLAERSTLMASLPPRDPLVTAEHRSTVPGPSRQMDSQ